MSLFKTLRWVILLCAFTSTSTSISAHVLNETTAQVILRDGQIEIKVITDIDHLISTLQNSQAWLLGDIDAVMPANLSVIQQQNFIKNALKQKMNLLVNEQAISFEDVALSNSINKNDDVIVFQAQHSFSKVTNLSISFHQVLGPVHVSFIKPKYKLLVAGETANIAF